jgi:hypothetical protein
LNHDISALTVVNPDVSALAVLINPDAYALTIFVHPDISALTVLNPDVPA